MGFFGLAQLKRETFCNAGVIVCDSGDGICKSEQQDIDSVVTPYHEAQFIWLDYVFAPEDVRFKGQFSKGDGPWLKWPAKKMQKVNVV